MSITSDNQQTIVDKGGVGHFSCKKCKNLIYLTSDLEQIRVPDLSSIIGEELASSGPYQMSASIFSPLSKRIISSNSEFAQPSFSKPFSTPSFTSSSMDHHIQVTTYLFDVLSGRTLPDHPMCQECADNLIKAQQQLLKFQTEERIGLEAYLNQLNNEMSNLKIVEGENSDAFSCADSYFNPEQHKMSTLHTETLATVDENEEMKDSFFSINDSNEDTGQNTSDPPPINVKPTQIEPECSRNVKSSKLTEVEAELSKLKKELELALLESDRLDLTIASSTKELQQRKEKFQCATAEYNEKKLMLLDAEDSLSILETCYRNTGYQFERLRRTNVLNAAFPIWYDGHIGVINGLHLGRLSTHPIEWSEINGAWGQCALLLQCLSKKYSFTFRQFSIVPMGNQSQIVHLTTERSYPLYNSAVGIRLFNSGKFDTAMTMFLECVGQLQESVERPPEFILPYKILDKGRMQDTNEQVYSIKLSGNSEENWTKTLKMLLINMKWIITDHVTKPNKDNKS